MGPCNRVLWESLTALSQIREVQFFEKINFLMFLGPKNEVFITLRGPEMIFFDPQALLYLWTHELWGDILLTFLYFMYGFWPIFTKKAAKSLSDCKSIRSMTPQKSSFQRQNKG